MAPVFLAKGMKCVNAAPVRGESSLCAQRLQRPQLVFPPFAQICPLCRFVSTELFFFFFSRDRNGEGHFKHRGKQPESEETKDPVGQKYRLRERYLRHQREKGHLPVKASAPGIHSGIFKGKHCSICCFYVHHKAIAMTTPVT